MEASSLLNEGLTLMLYGMGFVFIFLTLLVFVTGLMSKVVTKYEKSVGVLPADGVPSPTAVIPQHGPIASIAREKQDQQNLVSVLSAAVHEYRKRHK
ncbi:MAG: OadG family protein [Piscirickettsiaceae bacterium]|jgi:oxaloacetate decarboxylase (Na+ extruding) subunit gamma|nr:OadG family protein [Piscirickettsiaceae bacterium]